MRACQFPVAGELAIFDQAIDLLLARRPRIERGSALDFLPALVTELPPGQPLLVTDTYVTLFMSEEMRETLRRQLDAIARSRPVVWVSNNTLVPPGQEPVSTTAGAPIPPELATLHRTQLFGAVCVTTWPGGRRTPRVMGFTHSSGCWLEWRPEFGAFTGEPAAG
jgi:hypothetical protein